MLLNVLSSLFKKENEVEDVKSDKGYNPFLVANIQPQGGVKFENSYVKMGDGFMSCLHVYKYQNMVNDFWLEPIINMQNVITTIDVANANKREMIDQINKSMAEQNTRFEMAKDNVDRIDARETYTELRDLYNQISHGEVMKMIHLRLYVKGKTLEELEFNVREVMEELESLNFRTSVLLNEQEWEWESLFTSYQGQLKYANKRKGKELPSTTLAGGYPFHFTSLNDRTGTYYGTTDTNGTVIFDMFHKDKFRKFYNALMIGKMGSGKSTMLKKTVLDQAIKGNKIRILDVTGEFADLVTKLDGKQIALDGSQGVINPLHVYKTVTNDDGSSNDVLSFTQHLSKLAVFYNFINPAATKDEVTEFELMLRNLYIELELWSDNPDIVIEITKFKAEEFPTFSSFLSLIRKELYEDYENKVVHKNLIKERAKRLENIELTLMNLVKNYGNIFDGTSSIDNFDEELIVSFPLRNLTNLKGEIYQAQVFNIMNMLWDNMIVNGSPQLKAFNRGELTQDEARKLLIVIDEAHHLINTRNISQPAVLYLERFMREARKYFGGIFFVSHVISDFVPSGSSGENAENVKKLFQLTQYKFIGEQDTESMPTIQSVFDGQLTESESRIIPNLQTGRVVLCISGVKNIVFDVDVSKQELQLFGGGA
ncbi:MAG: VirB4 family type IV secretion system protein [Bacillaceae bacterium]